MEKFKKWFTDAGIRASKTIAQTAISLIPAACTIAQVDWLTVVGTAALAGIVSLLMSVANIKIKESDHNGNI